MHLMKQNLPADTQKGLAYVYKTRKNKMTIPGLTLDCSEERKQGLRATTFRDETALLG